MSGPNMEKMHGPSPVRLSAQVLGALWIDYEQLLDLRPRCLYA